MITESAKVVVTRGAQASRPLLVSHSAGSVATVAAAGERVSTDGGIVWILLPSEMASVLEATAGTTVALILWVTPGGAPDENQLAHPAVAGVLHPGSVDETVYTVVQAALRLLEAPAQSNAARMLEDVLEIGRALAAEKDLDALLTLVLTHARSLTGADGSSIYTRNRSGELYFRLWQNASNPAPASTEMRLVGPDSLAGYVARTGQDLQIDDAYTIPEDAPYRFNSASDRALGYRTRSLLTVPLTNKGGEVVGVLQLINCKGSADIPLRNADDVDRYVRPFNERARKVALALAGQAGVALENSQLYADIEKLFEGFIKASVTAIEARDPTTAGHSFRVAEFTERLAVATDRSDRAVLRQVRFSRDELRELRYAALLHDFGKVGVKEDVLVKAKKLYPHQLDAVKQRFKYARLGISWRAHRRLLEALDSAQWSQDRFGELRKKMDEEIGIEQQRLDKYLHTVLRANEPTVLHASAPEELSELMGIRIADEDGDSPLLHDFEFSGLTLPKGSLTADERVEIESHVSHTFSFLKLIPWTRDLSRLPDFAFAHHEKLDGTGYPRGLTAAEIPLQARMMTISDIYDALTAPDRPYKLAVPIDRALTILESEAKAGKLDGELLDVFIESGAYRMAS